MSRLATKIRTALALGPVNLVRALSYRLGVKLGINPVCRLQASLPQGPFFDLVESPRKDLPPAATQHIGLTYFGWKEVYIEAIPDWHRNPFNGQRVSAPERPWWQIGDFDPRLGDIKTVWEASRFDWVIRFGQAAATGDEVAIDRLNTWLADWCRANPAYHGPNWKCGQEASIRVMHLAITALITGQASSVRKELLDLVEAHLQRIEPTLGYAIAQDNNHGTSEACALYIGGSWLAAFGRERGRYWQAQGLTWLENRVSHLIEEDGTFSQYSVNYHRMMLDSYAMAECWRLNWQLPPFSNDCTTRLAVATRWLFDLVQVENGDAPNLGHNDGARLLPLTDSDYRDFRPTVQLASTLFCDRDAYGEGDWNLPLMWLGLQRPDTRMEALDLVHCPQGGYELLRQGRAFVLLNVPIFHFRPAQADALHLDLWYRGENLLRDGGTYSYNPDVEIDLASTSAQNTIEFDDHDQMPRLGRFLFGDWLKPWHWKPVHEDDSALSCGAAYLDYQGCFHRRQVRLLDGVLKVEDSIGGFTNRAILRWRLAPGNWKLDGNCLSNDQQWLQVNADVPIKRLELTEGVESRYYFDLQPVPVLEVEVNQPGTLNTEYRFSS